MGRLLALDLDRSLPQRLSVQLAAGLRAQIQSATLSPGDRVPSSRSLAAELGVSRAVVQAAYDQLIAEGWLTAVHGAGTSVSSAAPTPHPTASKRRPREPRDTPRISLLPGEPWTPPVADAVWRRAWRRVAHLAPPGGYPDPRGLPELRQALAELVGRARGVVCSAEEILVTSGSTHGLTLGLAALDRGGRHLAVENPGYRAAVSAAHARGWRTVDVAVDEHGMRVDLLEASTVDAVLVTPSHQYPMGSLLSLQRRVQLVDAARAHDTLLIEDDYDSEFRYDLAPLPPLAALAPDRVLYLGTVSKTLGAGIRLGWLAAASPLAERIADARWQVRDYPSVPLQWAMLSLIEDGGWDRAVRAARRLYAARDEQVAAALAPFGELAGVGAGLHSVLRLAPDQERRVVAAAAERGLAVGALSEYGRGRGRPHGLVIGYGRIDDAGLTRALDTLTGLLGG